MDDRALALPGAEWVLRAMHDVATSMGRRIPLPIERELMLALQRAVLHSPADVDALQLASPATVREAISDPDRRAFVVACAIHASIGVAGVVDELLGGRGGLRMFVIQAVALLILAMGLRAVYAVVA